MPLLVLRQGEQQVGAAGVEQSVLGDGARGDEADDLAPDRAFAVAGLRVLHLLGHGDAEAAADQAGEVGFGRVVGDAAHRDRGAAMLAALGQGDVERRSGGFRVGKEQFVEVAHAEEHQRLGVLCLGGEPLRHRGRRAFGTGDGCHGFGVTVATTQENPRSKRFLLRGRPRGLRNLHQLLQAPMSCVGGIGVPRFDMAVRDTSPT